MISSVVARQVRETILDYLRTTFDFADSDFEDALFAFLNGDEGLFKGPYLDVRLPFRKAEPGAYIPLDIRPSFDPYQHQMQSFQRLFSKDGHQPQHTLVTTGTGSGKTECFLYPILDHCWRRRDEPGVKAILLYPMNALASDQARRLAQTLWDDERLRGHVSAGLYVGGKGSHGSSDHEHLVDDRNILRGSPPDILLTNYKMLDFLLLRPEDRRLWQQNGPDTLRYLVLDELHTYDGAQGSDVACLIRRLKDRLRLAPGTLCAVGTSATIGSGDQDDAKKALTEFASKVFDERFFADSIITEDRYTAEQTLGPLEDDRRIDLVPTSADVEALDPERYEGAKSWLDRQKEIWLGAGAAELDDNELGKRLEQHDFLRQLLKVLDGSLIEVSAVCDALLPRVPEWEELGEIGRRMALDSFVALISEARRQDSETGYVEPFLTVQVQLWLRELRRLVQRLDDEGETPSFAWVDGDVPHDERAGKHRLPISHCRECGANGFAVVQRPAEQVVQIDTQMVGRAWLDRATSARYVSIGHAPDPDGFREYLCPRCLTIYLGEEGGSTCEACSTIDDATGHSVARPTLPVQISREVSDQKVARFLQRCPDCGSDHELSMLGSRAASLLSVAISHLFQTDYNSDKKLLAFTDSVQDASHRAGFFGARTYRFNLRTAIQTVVDAAEAPIALSALGDRVWEYWDERIETSKLIATLLPSDLRESANYQTFLERGGVGAHRKLIEDLRERLSWEVVLEYGLNVRVGRTLENTLCSTVEIDTEALASAAQTLALDIREQAFFGDESKNGVSDELVEHFLAGLLQRQRVRGGIEHPLLTNYVRESGNSFLLMKRRNPLMSPFSPQSVLPRFLTDRSKVKGEAMVFDSFRPGASSTLTWYQDWATRCFGVDAADSGVDELYREAMRRLENVGLLHVQETKRNDDAWGLNREKLLVDANTASVSCPKCRRRVVLTNREAVRWVDKPCTQYRCDGRFDADEASATSYYGRIYRAARLERIFSQEHTGLLQRDDRERIEDDFKNASKPGAPNLFVCTPTLEMGIDIGDLSAAILCTVPPTTANYLQRVGRAGRKTGNAFTLTLANSRPHDLYFHDEPMEMMAGQVLPPGCFLDAPEMLQRQMIAHAMDAWASQEDELLVIPPKTAEILSEEGRKKFPGRFIAHYKKAREPLTEQFLKRFDEHLSEDNRVRLREFGLGDAIPAAVDRAFDNVQTELRDLKARQDAAKRRLVDIEKNPETVENVDQEKENLEDTRKMLGRLAAELREKYPLNVLTDEGVLPNYAFPEPGVTLKSIVSSKGADGKNSYDSHEYMRPASSAIRELAPFNTFYAEGRKVHINEIDVGTKSTPLFERWRLCRLCSYAERIDKVDSARHDCPGCHDGGWSDAGRAMTLIHFRRSRSLVTRLEASTVDDTDDREEEHYDLCDLIHVDREQRNGARLIESIPFGFEMLRRLKMREINFGKTSDHKIEVAGDELSDQPFEVCVECGRVREGKEIQHSGFCKARKEGNKEQVEKLRLYREIESEALRILLPVSLVDLDGRVASFKAALQLGFRRHFQGDPGHLLVKSHSEPLPGSGAKRQFLVVFDGVPGGTGYLSELWQRDNFFGVLEQALRAIRTCRCRQVVDRDGCYRCLYAYQSQRDLAVISSRVAEEMLAEILLHRDETKQVDTLSDASLDDRLESELELKFLSALAKVSETRKGWSWAEEILGGEKQWLLTIDGRTWRIQTQIALGSSNGVGIATRPDFLITPANKDPDINPVAVYCDGFAYHACPAASEGRIGDDIAKRTSILQSGRYQVWTVTWKDLDNFEKAESMVDFGPVMLSGLDSHAFDALAKGADLRLSRTVAGLAAMESLSAYLTDPALDQWRDLAATAVIAWLSADNRVAEDAVHDLETKVRFEPLRFEAQPRLVDDPPQTIAAKYMDAGMARGVAACSVTDIKKGNFDKARITLRLFDEHGMRQEQLFERHWRWFFQAWNILQFHPGTDAISSEGLSATYPQADERADEVPQAAAGEEPYRTHKELDACLELATESARPLIRAGFEAGFDLPEFDVEIESAGPACGAAADFAWPSCKLAVFAESQSVDAGQFAAGGWQTLVQPIEPDELVEMLKGAK